jgi:hemerythrin-like domain-containing protein
MMESARHVFTPPLGAALHAEHVRLHLAFADMTRRAESGDYRLCDDAWDALAAELEKHFRFEEAELFPRFGQSGEGASDEVARLSSQHHALRQSVFEIGVGLQMRVVRPDEVKDLLASLQRHAALEDASLYPWATATFGARRPVCELGE